MNLFEPIDQRDILRKASSLVHLATSSIVLTMDVDEELRSPLPISYHTLLEKQATRGLAITRYGFGTMRSYKALHRPNSKLVFVYAGTIRRYQRMLVIDGKKGMFKVGEQGVYTEQISVIKALLDYVQLVYTDAAVMKKEQI